MHALLLGWLRIFGEVLGLGGQKLGFMGRHPPQIK